MHLTTRALIPALLATLLALAGCKTLPSASPQSASATPAAASGDAVGAPRVVQPIAIYLAQSTPGDQLDPVPGPDGAT